MGLEPMLKGMKYDDIFIYQMKTWEQRVEEMAETLKLAIDNRLAGRNRLPIVKRQHITLENTRTDKGILVDCEEVTFADGSVMKKYLPKEVPDGR